MIGLRMESPNWITDFLAFVADVGDVRLEYLPLYSNAFLADDNVEMMSTEEIGAFLLILMRAWNQQPPASIPDDDEKLSRWCRVTSKRWNKIKGAVLKPFVTHCDGRLYQKRMAQEWTKFARLYLSRKKGAEHTNSARRAGRQDDAERYAERDGQRTHIFPSLPPSSSTPSPPSENGSGNSGLGEGKNGNIGLHVSRAAKSIDSLERMGQVQVILNSIEMGQPCKEKIMARRDITAEVLKSQIADIRRDPKAHDVAAILTKRLGIK